MHPRIRSTTTCDGNRFAQRFAEQFLNGLLNGVWVIGLALPTAVVCTVVSNSQKNVDGTYLWTGWKIDKRLGTLICTNRTLIWNRKSD